MPRCWDQAAWACLEGYIRPAWCLPKLKTILWQGSQQVAAVRGPFKQSNGRQAYQRDKNAVNLPKIRTLFAEKDLQPFCANAVYMIQKSYLAFDFHLNSLGSPADKAWKHSSNPSSSVWLLLQIWAGFGRCQNALPALIVVGIPVAASQTVNPGTPPWATASSLPSGLQDKSTKRHSLSGTSTLAADRAGLHTKLQFRPSKTCTINEGWCAPRGLPTFSQPNVLPAERDDTRHGKQVNL